MALKRDTDWFVRIEQAQSFAIPLCSPMGGPQVGLMGNHWERIEGPRICRVIENAMRVFSTR
jgi:hypothetical protein